MRNRAREASSARPGTVQQTLTNWLCAQPHQPATTAELQTLLNRFVANYHRRRPHRSLPYHWFDTAPAI